jgi:glutaconate CoA-transferase subunit A
MRETDTTKAIWHSCTVDLWSLAVSARLISIDELAKSVPDGASLALPRDSSGCALEAVRALVRRGARNLRLIAVPQVGLQADLLIGAGCTASVEAAAVSLGEHGQAPRFRAAVSSGSIEMIDSTCPVIHAGFQAAEKGIPFMPLRGIIGSDLVSHRADWKIVDNPFGDGDDPILLLPAIAPDVALFHASRADREGNVWVGTSRELSTMAHAARLTFVTVEEIVEESLLADQATASGTLSGLYVSAIAEAKNGAWPVGLAGCYPPDHEHLRAYARAARTADGFEEYLVEHVRGDGSARAL